MSSENIDVALDKLLETSKQNNFSITTLSQQMGVVVSTVKQLVTDINDEKAWRASFTEENEMRWKAAEQKEYIEPSEQKELDQAIKSRVSTLFEKYGINYQKYYGKFLRKCWNDAKNQSNLVGKAGVYTKKMFFQEVKDYISGWTPYMYGVEGYKNYLDDIEEMRRNA